MNILDCNYVYEWLTGGVFSVLVQYPNDKKIRCNYHSDTGCFEFYQNEKMDIAITTEISPGEKEQLKFLLIQVLDDFLYEERRFLTMIEPFAK